MRRGRRRPGGAELDIPFRLEKVEDLARLSGVLTDTEGNAVVGESIHLLSPSRSLRYTARSSEDGAFVFENLAPQPYELVVRRDADAWIERTVLPAGDRFEELVLELPLAALTLEGTVRDERGPAADVAVEIQRFGLVARTRTGPDGAFRIAGLDAVAAYEILATQGRNGLVWRSSASSWAHEHVLLELEITSPGLAQVLAR